MGKVLRARYKAGKQVKARMAAGEPGIRAAAAACKEEEAWQVRRVLQGEVVKAEGTWQNRSIQGHSY